MTGLAVGQMAPPFRLPSAQGPQIGLQDFRGRQNVILWFTKGMACVFCRQQMSQLARGYPAFKKLNAEVLEITPSPVERARSYAQKYPLPFPYLCDPDYRVKRSWHLEARPLSLGAYVKGLYAGLIVTPPPPTEFGTDKPGFGELGMLVRDEDMGLFIVDRNGVVRFAMGGSYMTPDGPTLSRPIPSNADIERELERCEPVARGA